MSTKVHDWSTAVLLVATIIAFVLFVDTGSWLLCSFVIALGGAAAYRVFIQGKRW